MPETTLDGSPHSRDDAPWTHGGSAADTDFGTLFARPASGRAVFLSYDRGGRRHALTLFDRRALDPEMILHGRWFDVVRPRDPEAIS